MEAMATQRMNCSCYLPLMLDPSDEELQYRLLRSVTCDHVLLTQVASSSLLPQTYQWFGEASPVPACPSPRKLSCVRLAQARSLPMFYLSASQCYDVQASRSCPLLHWQQAD